MLSFGIFTAQKASLSKLPKEIKEQIIRFSIYFRLILAANPKLDDVVSQVSKVLSKKIKMMSAV